MRAGTPLAAPGVPQGLCSHDPEDCAKGSSAVFVRTLAGSHVPTCVGWKTTAMRLYVLWWGMPADPYPATTCFHNDGVIHV
jgi:hypothetical protein